MTITDELATANTREYRRPAVPSVFAEYKAFLATGRYPYTADVVKEIALKYGLSTGLGPNGRFDHDAIITLDDPILRALQHEVYLASGQHKVEEMEAEALRLTQAGYRPITELEPDEGKRVELPDGIVYRMIPAVNDWCLLPPRKRTQGVSLNGLQRQHEAFVLATEERQTRMNNAAVRMFKEAA